MDWYFKTVQEKIQKKENPSDIIESIFDEVVSKDL
jgi:hypothetical protein